MNSDQSHASAIFTTSMGHMGSAGKHLDAHFEVARPEYTATLRSVGLRPGWRVLDAGCGRGNFLPLIAEAVGPTGMIAALDLAPENVAVVEQSRVVWQLPTSVTAHIGSVTALPFPDAYFDAVWCANTMEYLTDADFPTALRECRRVVRPGGLVAVKDAAFAHNVFAPADPALFWRMVAAADAHSDVVHGHVRSPQTRRWLEAAGLIEVWQRTTLVERWAPLRPIERDYIGGYLSIAAALVAELAAALALQEEDRAFWGRHREASAPGHVADQPDFYWCEGYIIAVGRVPGPGSEEGLRPMR